MQSQALRPLQSGLDPGCALAPGSGALHGRSPWVLEPAQRLAPQVYRCSHTMQVESGLN